MSLTEKIIKKCEDFLGKKLPSEGLLTGQAVAEMYLDEIGFHNYEQEEILFFHEKVTKISLSYVLINSITLLNQEELILKKEKVKFLLNPFCDKSDDSFFVQDSDYYEGIKINILKRKKLKINDIDFFLINNDYKEGFLSEKKVSGLDVENYSRAFVYADDIKYDIVDTKNNGALNITTIAAATKYIKSLCYKDILQLFDINTTQFGIDMKTRTIVKTEAFDDFVKTGNMKVVNYSTPEHTYVRYLKKHQESSFRITENELLKLVFNIEHSFNRKPFYFGKKYKELFQKYVANKHKSAEYMYLECVFFDFNNSDAYQKFDLYKLSLKSNYYIKHLEDSMNEIGYKNFIDPYVNAKIIDLLSIGSAKKFKNNITVIKQMLDEKILDDLSSGYYINFDTLVYKFLDETFDFNVLRRIYTSMRDHEVSDLYYTKFNSLKELSEFDTFVRRIVKEYGYSVWAFIEKSYDFSEEKSRFSKDKFLKEYFEFINKFKGPLKVPAFEEFESKNLKFKELTTALELFEEGAKMRHCVGGYASEVKDGSTIIISIEDKNNKKLNSTIELRSIGSYPFFNKNNSSLNMEMAEELKSVFYVVQHRYFANVNLLYSQRDIDVVESLKNIGFSIISEKQKNDLLANIKSFDLKKLSEFVVNQYEGDRIINKTFEYAKLDEDEIPF